MASKYYKASDGDDAFNALLRESSGAAASAASDVHLTVRVKYGDSQSVIIARSGGMAVAYAFYTAETKELRAVVRQLADGKTTTAVDPNGRFAVINRVLVMYPYAEYQTELLAPAVHVCDDDDDTCACPSFGGMVSREELGQRGAADYEHCAFIPLNEEAVRVLCAAFLHDDDDDDKENRPPVYAQAENTK